MNFNEYVSEATRTESVLKSVKCEPSNFAGTLELAIAAAKLVDQLKREIFYGTTTSPEMRSVVVMDLITGLQKLQTKFNFPEAKVKINPRLLHGAMGVFTEAGEVLESIKKVCDGEKLDTVNLTEEIGDIYWYQAILHDATGTTQEESLEKNIAKLKARYPNAFDADKAVNRDLDTERAALEGEVPVEVAAE